MSKSIIIYTKPACAYCFRAKKYFNEHGIIYKEIDINTDSFSKKFLIDQGHKTVPQIYLNGSSIGGYEELIKRNINEFKEDC